MRVSGDLELFCINLLCFIECGIKSKEFRFFSIVLKLFWIFWLRLWISPTHHPLPESDTLKEFTTENYSLSKNKWKRAMKIYYFPLFFFVLFHHNESGNRKSDIDERIKIKSYSNSFLWATFLLHFDTFCVYCLLDYIRKFLRQEERKRKWRGGEGMKFLS